MSKFGEINNHIEDIPMRFSDKFLSLQVNTFIAEDDDGENVNLSKISEYKFIPELSAIEMFEQHQKKKLEQTLSNSVSNFSTVTNIINKTSETTAAKNIKSVGPNEFSNQSNAFTPVHKLYYSMVSGEILKPQTMNNSCNSISSSAPFHYSNCDNRQQQPTMQRNIVNPKEFENDNSSPFDNVELQTIDDIKELNHVFQSISTTADKSAQNVSKSNSHSNQTRNSNAINTTAQEVIANPCTYYATSATTNNSNNHHQSENLLSNPFYKPNLPYSCLPSSSTHLPQTNHPSVMPYQLPLPTSYNSTLVSNQTTSQNMAYSNPYTTYPQFEMKRSTSEKKDLSVSNIEDMTNSEYSTTLRSSKSVSDLTNMPKTQSLNNNFSGSNCSLSSESKSTYPVKGNHQKGSDSAPQLPDPYDTLLDQEKQFVDNLCQMGFCQDRVSRAVKHIGINDDKKIFEYLLAFQQLEDKRYDCYEIEIALHMNNYNKDKAETFLQALKQICDFGFNKEDTIKALFKSNNDRDRAIDLLLNQGK